MFAEGEENSLLATGTKKGLDLDPEAEFEEESLLETEKGLDHLLEIDQLGGHPTKGMCPQQVHEAMERVQEAEEV